MLMTASQAMFAETDVDSLCKDLFSGEATQKILDF